MCTNNWISKIVLFSFALAFIGCGSLLEKVIKSPEVKMESLSLSEVTLKGATVSINLQIFNPNSINLNVDSINYALQLNGKPIAEGNQTEGTTLKANANSQVQIPVKFEYSQVFDSLLDALQKTKSDYKVSGSARLGLLTIPFVQSGEINIKQ